MSRLNATIKLLFCWGELFFILVSLAFVITSGVVASGKVAALVSLLLHPLKYKGDVRSLRLSPIITVFVNVDFCKSFPMAQDMAFIVLMLSSAVFLCTCFGCCGAIRQTLRKGRSDSIPVHNIQASCLILLGMP